MGKEFRTLLIEDNPGDALLMQEMLKDAGDPIFLVTTAARLSTAIEYLSVESYDIILLDFGLPDCHGIETLHRVQAVTPYIPIIVSTGHDDEDLALRALQAGAQDYIVKGHVDTSLLTRAIRYAVERKHLERNYENLSRKYEIILGCAAEGIYGVNRSGITMFINPAAAKMLGYEVHELEGKHGHDAIHHHRPDGIQYHFSQCPVYQTLTEGKTQTVNDEVFWRKDGTSVPVEYTTTPIVEGSEIVGAVTTFSDITERKSAEEALRRSQERYRILFETANDPIFIVDPDFRYVDVNRRAVDLFGFSREEFLQMSVLDVLPPEQIPRSRIELDKLGHEGRYKKFIGKMRRKDGHYLDIEVSSSALMENGKVVGSTDIVRDITESKKMEEAIRHQATHDSLTGLPNRMLFMDHLTYVLSQAHRYKELIAVMFLDLDHFKGINDTLGHAVGDRLLQSLSERLKSCVRETDIVSRIGGDEYNILLPQMAHSEDAAIIARKILHRLQRPFTIEGNELHVTISIGISLYPMDGRDPETLVKKADIAMYDAKEHGRNNYRFYDPTMHTRTVERMLLENRLSQSLDRGELILFYQPEVDLASRKIVCVEALVRWQHPERGILSPRDFVPLAEETGFITRLDNWVLQTACSQARSWQKAGYPPICVTVNLSARHFQQPDLVEHVKRVLSETELEPQYLQIEITEGTAMHNMDQVITKVRALNEVGVSFAIDDFGTGYSSLSYLKRLPIQKLKIDKSFISGLADDPDDQAIVTAMIGMGHNLKLKVLAEGVENEEQITFLNSNGCDNVQGYAVGRPLPPEKLSEFLH